MGLRDVFRKMPGTIFGAFGDVATAATYCVKGVQSYNTMTGATASTDLTYAINVIVDSYSGWELTQQNSIQKEETFIRPGDKKILVKGTDLTASSISPKLSDYIQISGISYFVVSFETDAAEALWEFQGRKQ